MPHALLIPFISMQCMAMLFLSSLSLCLLGILVFLIDLLILIPGSRVISIWTLLRYSYYEGPDPYL